MSELEIALNIVKPYLVDTYKYPIDNIEGYGRVPIQIGSTVVWADFVFNYYNKFSQRKAFAVIEVKECDDPEVDFAIPQAESYAQRINAPFFCCTNGNVYNWFMTGISQGESIPINGSPTLPSSEHIMKPEKVYISPYLHEAINNFESSIDSEISIGKIDGIYDDTKWHNDSTNNLYEILQKDLKAKDKQIVLQALEKNIMKSRAKTQLLNNIENDFSRFISLIERLKDVHIPIEERLESCLGSQSKYGMSQCGLFSLTQILAGVFPREYTVIEYNATKAMQRFQLTNINFEVNTIQDYLYFNQICVNLYNHFKNLNNFNLSYVHNFLWHYEKEYLQNGEWK